jgi:formiminoglutamase
VAEWFSLLEPVQPPKDLPHRPDDPRLGEVTEFWDGNPAALRPGRAVIVGFPQDEGVIRNGGRPGAYLAPNEIRKWLYRLTTFNPGFGYGGPAAPTTSYLSSSPPLDAGNVGIAGPLERTQEMLGRVVGGILEAQSIPVVLGGGHETAFGHFLGYALTGTRCGIINLDAHLDVRPYTATGAHSGSPFRQALEHASKVLVSCPYCCVGAQPGSVAESHCKYVVERGGHVLWAEATEPKGKLSHEVSWLVARIARLGGKVYVSLDADVVRTADVPGVSAPNPTGLWGDEVLNAIQQASLLPDVSSFDLCEINPSFDRDDQSSRWAARVIWNFLIGVASRPKPGT